MKSGKVSASLTPIPSDAETESINRFDGAEKNRKPSKQGLISKTLFGDKEIDYMRNEWQADIQKFHKNLNKIESDLLQLEKLCKELNDLLGRSNNIKNEFSSVLENVSKLKNNTTEGGKIVKELEQSVEGFNLEKNKNYKLMKKKSKKEVVDKYKEVISQWKIVKNNLNNNNYKKKYDNPLNSDIDENQIKKSNQRNSFEFSDDGLNEVSDGESRSELEINGEYYIK
jgi:hypothetical protein